ncbi:MAG: ATP12 family protein [Bdellovibrionales bacterium]
MNEQGQKQAIVAYEVVEIAGARFALHRDGAVLRSPGGKDFAVPTKALAEAVAQEWRALKRNRLDPATMPLTRMAISALDGPMVSQDEAAEALLGFAQSDTLRHRAPAYEPLSARQEKVWQPLLDWFGERYGVELVPGAGIMPLAQSDDMLEVVKAVLAGFDPFALAGIGQVCHVTGSLALALALATGHLDVAQVFDAAELEALYQIERWGEDEEARLRLDGIRRDLDDCARWFGLLAR